MKNKPIILISLFALLIIVLFIGGVFAIFGQVVNPSGTNQKYLHQCTVNIDENFFGKKAKIESVECVRVRTCSSLFSFFRAEGNVEMYDSTGRLASKPFKTELFTGKDTVTLNGCSAENEFLFRLLDDKGNLLSTATG